MESIFLDSATLGVISEGSQGPAGPPSPFVAITKNAGVTMSAYRAVVVDGAANILLADNTIASHRARVIGVIQQAVAVGAPVSVTQFGEISFSGWAWTANLPIFLGAAGALTQTPPASPPAVFALILGVAVSATVMELDIRDYTNIVG